MIDWIEDYGGQAETAEEIGAIGERISFNELSKLDGLYMLKNLYIPFEDFWVQIDMLGVSQYGIFVFENKNYHGYIDGKFGDKFFKVFYGRSNQRNLPNPVVQNEAHVQAITSLKLGVNNINIHNVVIFNDLCKLHVDGYEFVYKLSDFISWYKSAKLSTVIPAFNLFVIIDKLKTYEDRAYELDDLHKLMLFMKRHELNDNVIMSNLMNIDLEGSYLYNSMLERILLYMKRRSELLGI